MTHRSHSLSSTYSKPIINHKQPWIDYENYEWYCTSMDEKLDWIHTRPCSTHVWAGRGKTPFKSVLRFPVEFEPNSSLSRRWCTFPTIERLPRLMNRSNSSCQSIKSDCTSGEDGILVVGVSRGRLLEYYKNAHFRSIIIFLMCKLCIRHPCKCSASIGHIAASGIRLSVPLRCSMLHTCTDHTECYLIICVL